MATALSISRTIKFIHLIYENLVESLIVKFNSQKLGDGSRQVVYPSVLPLRELTCLTC